MMSLQQSQQALDTILYRITFFASMQSVLKIRFEKQFIAAMDDDFNTPIALSVLFDLAHEIQRLRDKDADAAAAHAALLRYLGDVLGIIQTDPELFFQSGSDVDNQKIESLIAARQQARKEKNWAEADRIRDELASMSIVLEDTATGVTWRVEK